MTEKNYDDIINYDWNRDSLKDRMPLSQRAKIFLPFSALTGFDEAARNAAKGAGRDGGEWGVKIIISLAGFTLRSRQAKPRRECEGL